MDIPPWNQASVDALQNMPDSPYGPTPPPVLPTGGYRNLPPAPQGTLRLFRAEGPRLPQLVDQASLAAPGHSWTEDYISAVNYRDAAPDRRIKFVDVPERALGHQIAKIGKGAEFQLGPDEVRQFSPRWVDNMTDAGRVRGGVPLAMLGGLGLIDLIARRDNSLIGQLLGWGD